MEPTRPKQPTTPEQPGAQPGEQLQSAAEQAQPAAATPPPAQPTAPPPAAAATPPAPAQTQPAAVQPPPSHSSAPATADDVDVIEKEWVDAAEQVAERNAEDPHQEEEGFEDLQVNYLKKRYGKDIKKSEE